jgi:cytochrome c oxidase assembly protein subunit 15
VTITAWLRPDAQRYQRTVTIALWMLCAIVVTGAAVRLTGSGLGCTDWPTCEEGQPVAALEFHPMIEFVNRLITGLVSVAVIAAVLGARAQPRSRKDLRLLSWSLVLGVVAQIIIGAFVTKSDLKYSVVAVHFLASMLLVWAAVALVERASIPGDTVPNRRWTPAAQILVWLASFVLLSGSIVTSAGPHPGARPGRGGSIVPVERLPIDFSQVVRIHSVTVWVLVATTLVIGLRAHRSGDARVAKAATGLVVVMTFQGAIGYIQYFTEVPAGLVAAHMVGAVAVWVSSLRFAMRTASSVAPALTNTPQAAHSA